MRLLFPILCILGLSAPAFAQITHAQIAHEVCRCIQDKPQPVNKQDLDECIGQQVAANMTELKLGTVEAMRDVILKVNEQLQKNCPLISRKTIPNDDQYTLSEDPKALKYFREGNVWVQEGNFKKAIGFYKKAIKQDPEFIMAIDNLAVSYRQLKQFDKAIPLYERSLQLKPDGHLALMNLAVIHSLKGDFDHSLARYKQLLEMHPNDPEGKFGVGRILLIKEDYLTALPYLFEAHKLYIMQDNPYQADTSSLIGIAYSKMESLGQLNDFYRIAKENGIDIESGD